MTSNTLAGAIADRLPVVPDESNPFWSLRLEDLLSSLNSSRDGLAEAEAQRRLARHGPNSLRPDTSGHIIRLPLRQFGSPIVCS